ncbi:metalloregulator ArsR/SmtB family transcription factor [Rhizobium sp. VS19-DR104.2]|uniref:ArsR/SmtB family transcription factor n=1 Tax=unclassified Rhizobium TaxID=2613769 RepID=UPI001CC3358B|nr:MULTISPECIES: metalloregulator ArsR/SmtB family transcription factor [unclassified Rhizobium]MBZ5762946.1 metalloregulator ArsR/SmtB family transcription factor [Rhizobium sp. VS19-DR96]MBZ5768779.1 metalloregulator ArsR/SmtB family transcription factor [Rhizobium sp. VS19-DR129.2]MBZ5776395.1 metalloregulator ArsR/SmtB family transcription factor [Rhizobium sp. VS19-DRK62.2]MBZ5787602.1 metalloregulator ArsR/SmtB family transcription factor [Rhizobium sp. VS19-DR121]MBZ5804957.1 metalloreg
MLTRRYQSVLDIQEAAALLDAMANAKRLHILDILCRTEMSVGHLAKTIGLSQSVLSQHLAKLRSANLVQRRRDAQNVYYSCNSEPVVKILDILAEVFDDDFNEARRIA